MSVALEVFFLGLGDYVGLLVELEVFEGMGDYNTVVIGCEECLVEWEVEQAEDGVVVGVDAVDSAPVVEVEDVDLVVARTDLFS